MKFIRLVIKQWPWLVGYGTILIVLWGFFVLYSLPSALIIDLIRYTWFIVLAFVVIHALQQQQQLHNLHHLYQQKRTSMPKFVNPVLSAYSRALQELQQQMHVNRQQLEQQKIAQQDYLMTWSHEMKTPLMTLSVLADSKSQVSSTQAQQQVILLQNKIDLLLNYERLADFHHDLDFQWVLVDEILNPIIQKYALFFANKHLRLCHPHTTVQLLTDIKWLTVVLEQIIFNAIKYSTPHQTVTITCSGLKLQIKDEGIGISGTDLPRIFEPGFTGHNGREQQVATGMGLYLAQKICHNLEIKLNVMSHTNQGTTVILEFPANRIRLKITNCKVPNWTVTSVWLGAFLYCK